MIKPITVGFTIFDCNLERKIVKPTAIGLFITHSFLVKYTIIMFDYNKKQIVKPTAIGLFITHSFLVKYTITMFDYNKKQIVKPTAIGLFITHSFLVKYTMTIEIELDLHSYISHLTMTEH